MITLKRRKVTEESFERLSWLNIRNDDNDTRRVLFVRSPQGKAFFVPGGRLVHGMDDKEVLTQKIRLDLAVELIPDTIELYTSFKAPAFGKKEGVMVENRYFLAQYLGVLTTTPQIYAIKYLSYTDKDSVPITDADGVLMERLKQEGII